MAKVLIAAFMSLLALIIYAAPLPIVPSFLDTFASFSVELPWLTQRVLATYRFYWVIGAAWGLLSLLLCLIPEAQSTMHGKTEEGVSAKSKRLATTGVRLSIANVVTAFLILVMVIVAMYLPVLTTGETI